MRVDLRELLESAEEDLKSAKVTLNGGLFRISAFHSQQCVEKLLKAYIIA